MFRRLDIGTSLWSVARGLARDETRTMALLAQADAPREGGRDGSGNLTQRGLVAFCKLFHDPSVDQIRFMSRLLEPGTLMARIEIHVEEEEERAKRLLRGSFAVLREVVLSGRCSGAGFRRSPTMRSAGRGTCPRRRWRGA